MDSGNKQINRHRSKRLVIYNHKGGVGKTTLTANLAFALAALGNRVLLVDSDPQCNLTSYLVESDVVDDLLDHSDASNGRTLWSALRPIVEGTGEIQAVEPLERPGSIFLLPGDIRLSEFEEELNQLWNECLQRRIRGFRGTAALSLLVNRISSTHQIDYVFYDSGPNIGPLNRVILLDCDYFIVPVACDVFSLRALKTLGHTLAKWIRDWKTIMQLAPDGIYLIPGQPQFLGYIPQRFRVYRGQVTTGYASYLARIEKQIDSDIVSVLRGIDPVLASNSMIQNKLGQIKDFGTLANESQTQGVPIQQVTAANSQQKTEAEQAFSAIANKIIKRSGSK